MPDNTDTPNHDPLELALDMLICATVPLRHLQRVKDALPGDLKYLLSDIVDHVINVTGVLTPELWPHLGIPLSPTPAQLENGARFLLHLLSQELKAMGKNGPLECWGSGSKLIYCVAGEELPEPQDQWRLMERAKVTGCEWFRDDLCVPDPNIPEI